MADKAHKQTDADIKALEKVLKSVYSTAQSDLKKKWDKCMDRMQKASEAQYKAYTDALKSGDKEKAKLAKEAYQNTLKKMTSENWYKEQMDVITDEMTRLNERALAYTKDKVPKVYKQNYKAVGSSVSKQIPGYSFHMVDESTVKRMTKRLTAKKLNVHKDKRWNTKKANSQIMQGILQGESIGDIAKRLENVTNSTFTGALRTARTMMTEAQNAGRMDSYEQMEEDGLIVHKVWVATPDNHVRDTHLALDGQEVDIHEPFETIDGNELMYPGDPDGPPEEVYNCRCTMITHVVGFIDDNGVEHSLDYLDESDAHAEAIEREKEERGLLDETTGESEEIPFTLAESIEEAEKFASENFVDGGFTLTGGKSVNFKGVDLDVANVINKRLNEIYSRFDVEHLTSLEAVGKRNKKIYSKHSDAPFFASNFGNLGMNTVLMKSESVLQKYREEGENAFQYVINNINKLTGKNLELAKLYKDAGRSLVDDSLEGMITHEIGHRLSYMSKLNKQIAEVQKTDWQKYSTHISGYANHSFGEYVAESWTAYYNGETKLVQPELIKIFEGLKK